MLLCNVNLLISMSIAQVCDGTDIDECENDIRVRDVYATCINTNDSFTCTCIESYIDDGTNCSDQ